jgi:hypothetical protein
MRLTLCFLLPHLVAGFVFPTTMDATNPVPSSVLSAVPTPTASSSSPSPSPGWLVSVATWTASLALAVPAAAWAVSGGGLDYANLDISGSTDFANGNFKGKDFTQGMYLCTVEGMVV